MSLILCRQEPVTSPYFVEELGVHLYSSQELNYVIYHHPLLVMEDFVNERLAAFLRTELRLPVPGGADPEVDPEPGAVG